MRETIHTFTSHNIDNHRLPQGCAKVKKKKRSTINQRVCITRPLQKKKKNRKTVSDKSRDIELTIKIREKRVNISLLVCTQLLHIPAYNVPRIHT